MSTPPQTSTDWPVQVRLPGQAAAPDGPVDMVFMYLFHYAFRRDLQLFRETVPRTPLDDQQAWQRLADRWDVFATQLHHHHKAEDRVLWPWLLERAGAAETALLEEMAAEHDEIDPALARIAPALAVLADGPDAVAQPALVQSLEEAAACLDRHLAHEETAAIALMQRVMTDAEWKSVEKQLGEGQPATVVLTLVPWALAGLPPAARAEVLARLPFPMRLLARVLSPGFARRERRCFGVG